jgi:hypothetical protein
MQDRYVGDAGDFGKYGLLRYLSGTPASTAGLRLGMVWYLVHDESHNNDGRHLGYLRDPALRECDLELHDVLKDIVRAGERRVSLIEQRRVLPAAAFFSERLSSEGPMAPSVRMANRREWFKRALKTTQDCDLVFLDPDNGLEIPSLLPGSSKSHKYVLMHEVEALLARGQSVLIYQHLHRRVPHKVQVADAMSRLQRAFWEVPSIVAATFRRGSARTFVLLTSPAQNAMFLSRIAELETSGWGQMFEISYGPPVQSGVIA